MINRHPIGSSRSLFHTHFLSSTAPVLAHSQYINVKSIKSVILFAPHTGMVPKVERAWRGTYLKNQQHVRRVLKGSESHSFRATHGAAERGRPIDYQPSGMYHPPIVESVALRPSVS